VFAVAVALAAGGACSSQSFDRAKAVDGVLARFNGRLTRSQAECYVDRVADQLGAAALGSDAPTPEQVPRLTRIRIDCVGVASLGTSPTRTGEPDRGGGGTSPRRPGDDPALDALYHACADGSGGACDRLFDQAPLGSEYEDFALSCGGRSSGSRSSDRYPG
jgi:hypothetical protein